MTFFFDEPTGDRLAKRINLRDIGSRAKQWDHPVKGLFKYADAMRLSGGDILKLTKKIREQYCVSLTALAMRTALGGDWWTNMPQSDPPDGLIMTLASHESGAFIGLVREIEVVESRDEKKSLYEEIERKMTEKTYGVDTVLCCLVLIPGEYDLQLLSAQLKDVKSTVRHVLVVFAGAPIAALPSKEDLKMTVSVVQLLPRFEQTTVNLNPHLQDFAGKYEVGQESRLIEADSIYFATANPKFGKRD